MNYVWARQGMEEHREQSETIAVPSLDLKEKEERGFRGKVGKCDREIEGFGGGKTEEETREAKIKYYWGNILTVLMLHATVFRYSHFQSTAACPSNRDASTFWQKKKKKAFVSARLTVHGEDEPQDESTFLSLLLFVFTVQTAHAQLRASLA